MAILRIFVMLCLPAMLALVGGLPAILRTGQIDLLAWRLPALIVIIIAAAGLTIRRGVPAAVWAGVGTFGLLFLFSSLAAGQAPDLAAAGWLLLIILLSLLGGILLAYRHWWSFVPCAAALLFCWLSSQPSAVQTSVQKPTLAVISALPLFWQEGESGPAARADAPIITVLRQRFEVMALDSSLAPGLQQARSLLLAQPRAMSAAELVAVDKWVRAGGRALVLADPLLRWPSPLPLGDRRRPPVATQLVPLLDHWGVRLLLPSSAGENRQFLKDDQLLTTVGAGGFQVLDGSVCRIESMGLIARCLLGRGTVVLLADADVIDDRLWLADPAAPLEPRQWTADTPAFVAQALGSADIAGTRNWVRSAPRLTAALRWAFAAGIFWAILGCLLFRRGNWGRSCSLSRATSSR